MTISPSVYFTDLSVLRRSHPARLGRASILPVNSMVLAAHLSNPWWQKSRKLSLSAPFFPTCSRMSDGACSSAARAARQRPFHFPPFSLASFRARAPASCHVNFTVKSIKPPSMSKRPAPPLAVRTAKENKRTASNAFLRSTKVPEA